MKNNFSLLSGFNGSGSDCMFRRRKISIIRSGATETCNKYFAEVDDLVKKATEKPVTTKQPKHS